MDFEQAQRHSLRLCPSRYSLAVLNLGWQCPEICLAVTPGKRGHCHRHLVGRGRGRCYIPCNAQDGLPQWRTAQPQIPSAALETLLSRQESVSAGPSASLANCKHSGSDCTALRWGKIKSTLFNFSFHISSLSNATNFRVSTRFFLFSGEMAFYSQSQKCL